MYSAEALVLLLGDFETLILSLGDFLDHYAAGESLRDALRESYSGWCSGFVIISLCVFFDGDGDNCLTLFFFEFFLD